MKCCRSEIIYIFLSELPCYDYHFIVSVDNTSFLSVMRILLLRGGVGGVGMLLLGVTTCFYLIYFSCILSVIFSVCNRNLHRQILVTPTFSEKYTTEESSVT